ncbi:hypothetical protein [Yersinia intermedia]|uniref:hypothetical protein n=1 Tax=Yersinia intermedia TaxID=631 RepID=UPI00065D1792|nr:hypothetical protein [Yersinia intermedia]CRY84081.1 Uncharacterised protein [Yersinia intermedia]
MSKVIRKHIAVANVSPAEGADDGMKYDVLLKRGWHFRGKDGKPNTTHIDDPELRRSGFFSSVRDFNDGWPQRLVDHNGNPVETEED